LANTLFAAAAPLLVLLASTPLLATKAACHLLYAPVVENLLASLWACTHPVHSTNSTVWASFSLFRLSPFLRHARYPLATLPYAPFAPLAHS